MPAPSPQPPATSEAQCTRRYTRDTPTAAAITRAIVTSTPLVTSRSLRVSATATATHAVAYAAWPLG